VRYNNTKYCVGEIDISRTETLKLVLRHYFLRPNVLFVCSGQATFHRKQYLKTNARNAASDVCTKIKKQIQENSMPSLNKSWNIYSLFWFKYDSLSVKTI